MEAKVRDKYTKVMALQYEYPSSFYLKDNDNGEIYTRINCTHFTALAPPSQFFTYERVHFLQTRIM